MDVCGGEGVVKVGKEGIGGGRCKEAGDMSVAGPSGPEQSRRAALTFVEETELQRLGRREWEGGGARMRVT